MLRTNYIFVNFENVQEHELDRIAHKPIKVSLVRPKKRPALESQVQALFGKTLSSEDVQETIQKLVQGKILTFSNNGAVNYAA